MGTAKNRAHGGLCFVDLACYLAVVQCITADIAHFTILKALSVFAQDM